MASHQVRNYYIINLLDTNQLVVTPHSWICPRAGGTVLVFLPLSYQDHDLLAMSGGPYCTSWDQKYAKIVRGYDTYAEANCYLNQLNTRMGKHAARNPVRNPFEKPDREQTAEINENDNQNKTQLEILLTSKSSLETILTSPTPQPPARPSTSTDTNTVSRVNTHVDTRMTITSVYPFRSRKHHSVQNQGSVSFRGEENFNPILRLSQVIESAVTATLDPENRHMNSFFNQTVALEGPNNQQQTAATLGPEDQQTKIVCYKRVIAQVGPDNKKTKKNVHDDKLSQKRSEPLKVVNPVNPTQVARVAPLNNTSVIVFNKYAIRKPDSNCTSKLITGKPIDANKNTSKEQGDVIEIQPDSDCTTILNIEKPATQNKSEKQVEIIEIMSDSDSNPDLNEVRVRQCISSGNEIVEVEEAQAEPMLIHSRPDYSTYSEVIQPCVTGKENIGVEERIAVETHVLLQKSMEPLTEEHLSKSIIDSKTNLVDHSVDGAHGLENKILENFNSTEITDNFQNQSGDTHNTSEENCQISDNINCSALNLSAETQKATDDIFDFEKAKSSLLEKLLFTHTYEHIKIGLASSKILRKLSESLSTRLEAIIIANKTNEEGSTEQQLIEKNDFMNGHELPQKSNESIDRCSQESQVATEGAPNNKTKIEIRHSRRLMKRRREPATSCPPPDGNRWTLKYQIEEPSTDFSKLTKLLPDSDIFVSARGLTYAKAAATSSTDFIQLLMHEIFNERALKECTISDKPRKNGRPRLNRNGVNTLCEYVVHYCATIDGWDRVDAETVRRIIANRLSRGKSK